MLMLVPEETRPARSSHQQIPRYDVAGLWLIKVILAMSFVVS